MSENGTVLILGSAPDALRAREFRRAGIDTILTINNAWQLRPDWDLLLHPKDFPAERRPTDLNPDQRLHSHPAYVPAVNTHGGFVFCGGTMAFTAGYWALTALRPRLLAFLGCDMTYAPSGPTHFYGTGAPDPLRPDPTLRSLEAKSARLMLLGAAQGTALVNLSDQSESRLVLPRLCHLALPDWRPADSAALLAPLRCPEHLARIADLRAEETALGYDVPSGKYWKEFDRFDPDRLARIDARWLGLVARTPVAA